MAAPIVYVLCALTAGACAWLLLRTWRVNRVRLLLWTGACFCVVALSNTLVFIDLIVFPEVSLVPLRVVISLVSAVILLVGLIWEAR